MCVCVTVLEEIIKKFTFDEEYQFFLETNVHNPNMRYHMSLAVYEAFKALRKLPGFTDAPEMKPPATLPIYNNINMELNMSVFDFEKENNANEIEDYLVILNEENVTSHNNNTNNNGSNNNNNQNSFAYSYPLNNSNNTSKNLNNNNNKSNI